MTDIDAPDIEPLEVHDVWPTERILSTYSDGDEHGWGVEFAWLRDHDPVRLAALSEDIALNGIQNPVLLGPDQRVWDGHHRLCVAVDRNIPEVPISFAVPGDPTAEGPR